jgi:3-hydroxyacyl-[acyl-carrier-protein] dehydratase
MLKDNLYFHTTVLKSAKKENSIEIHAKISIIADHPVLRGHFPGKPIVPGVCLIQMIRETMEMEMRKKFKLAKAGMIKFLSPLSLFNDNIPDLDLSIIMKFDEQIVVDAVIFHNQVICLKFAGHYCNE